MMMREGDESQATPDRSGFHTARSIINVPMLAHGELWPLS